MAATRNLTNSICGIDLVILSYLDNTKWKIFILYKDSTYSFILDDFSISKVKYLSLFFGMCSTFSPTFVVWHRMMSYISMIKLENLKRQNDIFFDQFIGETIEHRIDSQKP